MQEFKRRVTSDEFDYVYYELELALKLNLEIIPIILGNSVFPDPSEYMELPDDIKSVVDRLRSKKHLHYFNEANQRQASKKELKNAIAKKLKSSSSVVRHLLVISLLLELLICLALALSQPRRLLDKDTEFKGHIYRSGNELRLEISNLSDDTLEIAKDAKIYYLNTNGEFSIEQAKLHAFPDPDPWLLESGKRIQFFVDVPSMYEGNKVGLTQALRTNIDPRVSVQTEIMDAGGRWRPVRFYLTR